MIIIDDRARRAYEALRAAYSLPDNDMPWWLLTDGMQRFWIDKVSQVDVDPGGWLGSTDPSTRIFARAALGSTRLLAAALR